MWWGFRANPYHVVFKFAGRRAIATYARIVDYDKMFANLTTVPIIANEVPVEGKEDKERLNDLIYTHYEGDFLQEVPSCNCRETKGVFNENLICELCYTKVTVVTERPLEAGLWMQPPPGVKYFINPQIWTMMSQALTYGENNLLRWLCDPRATLPEVTRQPEIRKLRMLKLPRGINNFHDHFDEIMAKLFENRIVKVANKNQKSNDLLEFIRKHRHLIFCKQLPMQSRLGFITEHNLPCSYMDPTMVTAINALLIITTAMNSPTSFSLQQLESYTVKANMLLAEYYQLFTSKNLISKPGLYRKHIAGTRSHFTFRGVISSISAPHDYEELHIPWSVAMLAFKLHIVSKLIRGAPDRPPMTPNDAMGMVYENTLRYNETLDKIMQELIAEAPGKGIPVLLGRNPTLTRASIQKFYITKVHKDPQIKAISMSVLCLVGPNADFDGDALNGTIILDHEMAAALEPFAPHNSVMDLSQPHTLSRNITVPSPALINISSWVERGRSKYKK